MTYIRNLHIEESWIPIYSVYHIDLIQTYLYTKYQWVNY